MSVKARGSFQPGYGVPPGETLRETLETRDLTQADLAERTGRPKKTINEIIQGKAAITSETALQLERVLGIPASFWNNLEHQYRTSLARLAESELLKAQLPWLAQFPVKQMAEREWIKLHKDRVDLLREVLQFFGVVSTSAFEEVWQTTRKATAYRQSRHKGIDFAAIAAWLRRGEIEARDVECQPFDAILFRTALKQIRTLTTADPRVFCTRIKELCASAGVVVVFVPELPRMRLFGAARWLAPDKALIQLTLYLKREDQLWFSFFHEAGHILLHGRREVFIDGPSGTVDQQENEANAFASNTLIDPADYADFIQRGDLSRAAVVQFANRIGIAPAIVVGRLQHDRHLDFNQLHGLVGRFKWAPN